MPKKKGSVSGKGVKPDIIKCILSINEPVTEQYIREYLKEECKKKADQGNINRHLHELCEELACIQLIPPVKKGLANHWNITKTEHLRNIRDKFQKIQVNKFEKALMIVLQKNGYDIFTFKGVLFYMMLLLSPSFFNACIRTNINILLERTWITHASKHSIKSLSIKDKLHKCYISYIVRYPNFKMPYKSFVSMLTQMSQKDISLIEKFMKIWEEELLGISKEESHELHREVLEKDLNIYRNMRCIALELPFYKLREDPCFGLLFEHYLFEDILSGIAQSERMKFANHNNAIFEYKRGMSLDEVRNFFKNNYLSILEQISNEFAKHKHPSIFGDIYKNPTDTFNGLIEILNKNHEIPKEVFE